MTNEPGGEVNDWLHGPGIELPATPPAAAAEPAILRSYALV